jgi:site-specific DNA recombinase
MFDVTAAIYIRVSTEEQTEGWSLEAQRCLCQALAQSRGWSVYKIYEEPGQSAKTDRRPAFQRMMWDAEWQRFDVILVHKLDRFSRSLPGVVSNVARLKRAGVGLVSVSESWIDTTTSMGEIMLYLCALLAQWDNENRAHETAKGKAARAHNGLWNGSLSFGYTTLRELKYERVWLEKEHEEGRLDGTAYRRAVERIEAYMARFLPGSIFRCLPECA